MLIHIIVVVYIKKSESLKNTEKLKARFLPADKPTYIFFKA